MSISRGQTSRPVYVCGTTTVVPTLDCATLVERHMILRYGKGNRQPLRPLLQRARPPHLSIHLTSLFPPDQWRSRVCRSVYCDPQLLCRSAVGVSKLTALPGTLCFTHLQYLTPITLPYELTGFSGPLTAIVRIYTLC